jgi:hypothetical protein
MGISGGFPARQRLVEIYADADGMVISPTVKAITRLIFG